MPVVPFTSAGQGQVASSPQASERAMPDPTFTMMAAAQMHGEGRLIQVGMTNSDRGQIPSDEYDNSDGMVMEDMVDTWAKFPKTDFYDYVRKSQQANQNDGKMGVTISDRAAKKFKDKGYLDDIPDDLELIEQQNSVLLRPKAFIS